MSNNLKAFWLLLALAFGGLPGIAAPVVASKSRTNNAGSTNPVLWREPVDISHRNLFWGPGGKKHAPPGNVFTFIKEDMDGSNPKFAVRDADGVEWKVKLGVEARPETAATRLVWAAGYFADEDYFLPLIRVTGLPKRVHRGREFMGPNGLMYNARLERHRSGLKHAAEWKWRDNPFLESRQLNGLRVMMALMNSWDLKDLNNGILEPSHPEPARKLQTVYEITDLGASFGTTGFARSQRKAKGNLKWYERSKFITKVTPEYVDFATPGRPSFWWMYDVPAFVRRVRMQGLGKHVPREDARWIGDLLGRLSRRQIADAFRAAGYAPAEVNGFTAIVERRIAELRQL